MNEYVCNFVVPLLDRAYAPGNVPSRPASSIKAIGPEEGLSHQVCHHHEHAREGI